MEKSSEVSLVIDASIVDEMENVPHSTASERKIDYKSVSEAYKRFWATCEDAYVFNVGEKVEIDITKLIPAPPTYNIRSQESRIVQDMVNYLTNIPDKSTKQTLCVMPVGLKEKPKTWSDMENCDFYIINGQHSVEASKFIVDEKNEIAEDICKHFQKWNCFVVWSDSPQKLKNISAYYNRTNHFVPVQPSRATNILGARTVWKEMGCPKIPYVVGSVGTSRASGRSMENTRIKNAFAVCNSARLKLNSLLAVYSFICFRVLTCYFHICNSASLKLWEYEITIRGRKALE